MSFDFASIELSDGEITNLASFAELSENYEHAYALISLVLEHRLRNKEELLLSERNLYGNAVSKIINRKYEALQKIMYAAMSSGNLKVLQKSGYDAMLCLDIETCCGQMIDKLKPFVLGKNIENDVYLLKIMGELYHLAWKTNLNKHEYKDLAKEHFIKAHDLARQLDISNPVRLSLIWNYSGFMYELEETRDQAIDMASKTYEEASKNANEIKQEWKTKTQGLLESIKGNIISWTESVNKKIKNININVNNNNNNNNDIEDEAKLSENVNDKLIINAQIDPVVTTASSDVLLDQPNELKQNASEKTTNEKIASEKIASEKVVSEKVVSEKVVDSNNNNANNNNTYNNNTNNNNANNNNANKI